MILSLSFTLFFYLLAKMCKPIIVSTHSQPPYSGYSIRPPSPSIWAQPIMYLITDSSAFGFREGDIRLSLELWREQEKRGCSGCFPILNWNQIAIKKEDREEEGKIWRKGDRTKELLFMLTKRFASTYVFKLNTYMFTTSGLFLSFSSCRAHDFNGIFKNLLKFV